MSDLTAELRRIAALVPTSDAGVAMLAAAARIEALEATVAEALEVLTREGIWLQREHTAIAILSRVPQGAAEPNQHICFSGCHCGGQGTTVVASRVGVTEPTDPLDSAIDTLARYIIWQQIDPERVEWEDWPEVGEFDFERLVKRVEELAPPAPDLNERRDAQEYLKNRISYAAKEGNRG